VSVYQPERQNFAVRPDDKRLTPKKRLSRDLKERWASIIEEDLQTDGLWLDVAKFYGLVDVGEIGPDREQVVRAIVARVARSLRR
jgi:hypothetical protein